MRRLLLLPLLLLLPVALPADDSVEIVLQHLTLRWTAASGLLVLADGQQLLNLAVAPVVAHPPGWAWSYTGREGLKGDLQRQGQQQTLTVTCADPKLPWTQTIVAGPGDRYTLTYRFRQLAWDEPMEYEVCAAQPTPLFVGGAWKARGQWGEKSGVIPLQFAGQSNPFGEATTGEFAILPGQFGFTSTAPLTLYDYKQRQHLWLGRDGPMPKGQEQTWAVDFRFAPQPFVIGGVEITNVRIPLQPLGETSEVSLSLRRAAGGPDEVTLAWGERKEGATPVRQAVKLTDKPQTVRLAVKLPEPGTYAMGFDVLQGDKALYASPALTVTLPRLLAVKAARVPFTPTDTGALLVRADPLAGEGLTLAVEGGGSSLYSGPLQAGVQTEVPISLAKLPLGRVPLKVTLSRGGQSLSSLVYNLLLAAPNPNGVAIDNRSRTLLVAGLPYCPQSCYADMRTVDDVIEAEPVWGFNTIAPYLSTNLEQRRDRTRVKQMLDRCAQVGLRVQLAVHGVSRPPHTEEKWQWLKEEIEAFRDHPALLSYYLADEPELGWAKPEDCELAYNKIKALDPWHPVTMVFCVASAAARYARGMDVCMTDPYPIPNGPVTRVTEFCDQINRELGESMPLWVVPQAFGGGEGWKREPSRQEERVMTYLALIHGATGIQYFIRRPPATNPTSPDLWSECRRLMLELSQLTPALAGERLPWPATPASSNALPSPSATPSPSAGVSPAQAPPAPAAPPSPRATPSSSAGVPPAQAPAASVARSSASAPPSSSAPPSPSAGVPPAPASPASVQAAVFKERGALTVLCANTKNEPATLQLALPTTWSGSAEVLFENRRVPVEQGRLTDMVDAMGTRVYRLQVEAPPAGRVQLAPKNLIVNASWEEAANVGTPDGCYTGYGPDKGASWYVDPRVAIHGRQSLRLRTPVEGQGMGVSPFPVRLAPATKYALSIWAKGERTGQKFSFTLDAAKGAQCTHELTTDWQEYRVEFTATEAAKNRISAHLSLISAGSAWFDALQLVTVP